MKANWFDRWFMKMSRRSWELAQQDGTKKNNRNLHVQRNNEVVLNSNDPLTINIHKGLNGGYAAEVSSYNINTDSYSKDLYIIPENANLAKQLSGIITQHNLRR